MNRRLLVVLSWLVFGVTAHGQETPAESAVPPASDEVTDEAGVVTPTGDDPDQPRSMSGMSILGNEEAPKALVIVPWKSSELGDEIGLSENLDDKANPVDRDVFLRELRFYEIRESEQ
ncbi:MAG: hypothetical protein R3315_14105 [Woeseiaceae bacterium]|nr:hypothetical protein [Woeseiaceae bacterium]